MNKYLLFCILIGILLLLLDNSEAKNDRKNKKGKSSTSIKSNSPSGSKHKTKSGHGARSKSPSKHKSKLKKQKRKSNSPTEPSTKPARPKRERKAERKRNASADLPGLIGGLVDLEGKVESGVKEMHDLIKKQFDMKSKSPANKWTPDEEKEVNAFKKFLGATRVIENGTDNVQVNDVDSATATSLGGTATNNVMTMSTSSFIQKMEELVQKNKLKIDDLQKKADPINQKKAQVLTIMNQMMIAKIAGLKKPIAPSTNPALTPPSPSPNPADLEKPPPPYEEKPPPPYEEKQTVNRPPFLPMEKPPASTTPLNPLQEKIQTLFQQTNPAYTYDIQLEEKANTALQDVDDTKGVITKKKIFETGATHYITPVEKPEQAIETAWNAWQSESGNAPNHDLIIANSRVGCTFKNLAASMSQVNTFVVCFFG